MAWVNNYKAPATKKHTQEPTNAYDLNFAFPLPSPIETSLVKLTPFLPSIHLSQYCVDVAQDPAAYQYMPPDWSTEGKFLNFIEDVLRSDPGSLLFAILDKAKLAGGNDEASCVSGIIGLYKTSPVHLSTEIGPVVILPAYRGSVITKHAIGLILRYTLNLPTESNYGLGLRRVAWTSHPANVASIRIAERMGLKNEGTMRWAAAFDEQQGKIGDLVHGRLARHSVLLAICWDDWENGGRALVDKMLETEL